MRRTAGFTDRSSRPALILLALVGIFLPHALPAQGLDLLFPGDEAFDEMRFSAILEGRVPETNAFPIFGEKPASGSASGSAFGLSLATPTFYYDSPAQSIDDLAGNSDSDGAPLPSPALPELQRFAAEMPGPLELELEFGAGDYLSFRIDIPLTYRVDRFVGTGSTLSWDLEDWGGNLLGNMEFPRKSWVALGRPGFGAALGRFPAGMASGKFGGAILNPAASWYDQARFSLGEDRVRFTWMLATSSAQLSAAESEVQFRREADGTSFWDSQNDHDRAGGDEAVKLASWHQFEWMPLDWLSLGFAESSMMGGRAPGLTFFLPAGIWHNTYAAGYSNVTAELNFAMTPIKGLLLSGEYLVDDARSGDEPATSKPAAGAWRLQAEWDQAPSPGTRLEFGAEYGHADTWTYVRWQPYLSWYQRQVLPGGRRGVDLPLGSPYGPDSDYLGLWAGYSDRQGRGADLAYEFVVKGPIRMGMMTKQWIDTDGDGIDDEEAWIPIYYDYDLYAGEGALAAILARPDEIRHILSFDGRLPLGKGLTAVLKASLGWYRNYGNVAGESETLFLLYAGLRWSPVGGK